MFISCYYILKLNSKDIKDKQLTINLEYTL